MSFPHEVIAAFPTGGQPNPGLIRAMCTRRFAYCLADDEAAGDFVAKDPVSSIPPLNLIQFGTLFAYDESDSTTEPSDVCLVTSDACRYKSGSVELPNSVLTYSTTAQPADVDVSDGDTFLLPIGATGADWAGKAGQIAIRKGARWYFAISPIGRGLYVEDEDARYYRNASGVWTAGSGSVTLAANAVKITNVLGAKASFVVKVENQTTNTPPASPVAPVAYVIGPSPTDAWASHAGELAYCLVDGMFTIIAPDEGDEVWDKTLNNKYVFNGTAWISAAGTIVNTKVAETSTALTTTGVGSSGNIYTYSDTVAPSTASSMFHVKDSLILDYASKKSGARLLFEYSGRLVGADSGGGTSVLLTAFLLRDSVAGALDWKQMLFSVSDQSVVIPFEIDAPDGSAHDYRLGFTIGGSGNRSVATLGRRRLRVMEIA